MRLLHTSDWHLGKKLESTARFDEQVAVMQEICRIADREAVQAIIVAGDLFDTFNPPAEAVELFYKTLRSLSNDGRRPVICIAGNHDSPERIEAPDPLARACGIVFVGYPNSKIAPFELETGLALKTSEEGFIELSIPGVKPRLRLLLMPYASEIRYRTCFDIGDTAQQMRDLIASQWKKLSETYCDSKGVNVLVDHLFMIGRNGDLPEEPEDENPILHVGGAQAVFTDMIPPQIQYTACGHLHRQMIVGGGDAPVVYSGSPLAYSFGEADQDKFVMIVDIVPGQDAKLSKIKLQSGRRLSRGRFVGVDSAIEWLHAHSDDLVEVTVESDTYITAEEKARLYAAHKHIITLIPIVKDAPDAMLGRRAVDLSKDIYALFEDYFMLKLDNQKPNEEMIELFTEILMVEEDES